MHQGLILNSLNLRYCIHGTCTGRYDEESESYESNHVIPLFIQPYFRVLPPSSPLNHRYELQQEPKVGITTFIKVGITTFITVGITTFIKVGITTFIKVGITTFIKVVITTFIKVPICD